MPESEPKPKLIELVAPGAGQGWKATLKNGKAVVIHEIPAPAAEAAAAVPRIQRLAEHPHPALAPVLAWGTDPNGVWVAAEPNEGVPLGTILSRGPLTPPAAAALGAAVLSGVAALHEAGIAMGGFGASAIRVTGNGEVRLTGHPAAAVRGAPSQSDLRADVRSCGMAICAAFGVDPAGAPAPPSIPPGLVVTMRSMASGAMGPAADRAQGALREMASALLAPDRMTAAQSELALPPVPATMASHDDHAPKSTAAGAARTRAVHPAGARRDACARPGVVRRSYSTTRNVPAERATALRATAAPGGAACAPAGVLRAPSASARDVPHRAAPNRGGARPDLGRQARLPLPHSGDLGRGADRSGGGGYGACPHSPSGAGNVGGEPACRFATRRGARGAGGQSSAHRTTGAGSGRTKADLDGDSDPGVDPGASGRAGGCSLGTRARSSRAGVCRAGVCRAGAGTGDDHPCPCPRAGAQAPRSPSPGTRPADRAAFMARARDRGGRDPVAARRGRLRLPWEPGRNDEQHHRHRFAQDVA